MAIFKAFKAVRPSNLFAKEIISLPYDVMNRKEAKQMALNNKNSFLHITRSEIDLPDDVNSYETEVYKKANDNLNNMIDEKIFIQDEKPCFYIYKQVMNGNIQTGIVGCASIDDYLNNVVKKHEFTRIEKEKDRINHFDFCNANTEPVFLTFRNNLTIHDLIKSWTGANKPTYDLTTPDEIQHVLWVVDSATAIEQLSGAFSNINALYIADGHHRTASAVKVGLKRRLEHPDYDGSEEFNYFMAVAFPDVDLNIFDYNRVVKDLNNLSPDTFLKKVSESFTIETCNSIFKPETKHSFGMFLDDTWYKLTAKDSIIDSSNIINQLDVSILQNNLLTPILGIHDPRTDKRIDFIGGIRGLEELERRVHDDMRIAFSLFPVEISDLLAVSDMDEVMPPKSTWFEPKLGSGLFVHKI